MNRETITKILEAVYNGAEDVGAGDEFAVAIFSFACMLPYFKLGGEARQYIEKNIRSLAAEIDFPAAEIDSQKDEAAQS